MRLISCSKCFKLVKGKDTKIIDGLRVCHDCRHKQEEELKKAFFLYNGGKK